MTIQVEPDPEYRRAPQVEEVAQEAITRWHGHLVEAQIAYLFRSPKQPWESKGRTVMGKVYKVQPHARALVDYDFVLVTNADAWKELGPEQRLAYMDHELSHCEETVDRDGNRKWTLTDHDVEDFTHVVQRHGLWQPDLQRLGKALDTYKQGSLFAGATEVPAAQAGGRPAGRERRVRLPAAEAALRGAHPDVTVELVVPGGEPA